MSKRALSSRALAEPLEAYVREHFEILTESGDPIPYSITRVDLFEANYFKHFAQVFFETNTLDPVPARILVKSTLLFELDKYSRSLLCMEYNHFTQSTHAESFHHAIFNPSHTEELVDFNNIEQIKFGRRYFVWEGIRHIWIGIDHILFLITLLLPSRADERSGERP